MAHVSAKYSHLRHPVVTAPRKPAPSSDLKPDGGAVDYYDGAIPEGEAVEAKRARLTFVFHDDAAEVVDIAGKHIHIDGILDVQVFDPDIDQLAVQGIAWTLAAEPEDASDLLPLFLDAYDL